jgi:hypothetical protein
MTKTATKPQSEERANPVVLNREERGQIWQKARGMWKDRKPDPIKELKKMRKEWERKLP